MTSRQERRSRARRPGNDGKRERERRAPRPAGIEVLNRSGRYRSTRTASDAAAATTVNRAACALMPRMLPNRIP